MTAKLPWFSVALPLSTAQFGPMFRRVGFNVLVVRRSHGRGPIKILYCLEREHWCSVEPNAGAETFASDVDVNTVDFEHLRCGSYGINIQ